MPLDMPSEAGSEPPHESRASQPPSKNHISGDAGVRPSPPGPSSPDPKNVERQGVSYSSKKSIAPKSARPDMSDDEQPGVDDGTLSDVLQQPIKAAGDLSEVADAAESKTTDDLARDLEAVASKAGGPTAWEMLEEILQRVRRIEEHLRIGDPQEPEAFAYPNDPSQQPPRRGGEQHPIVRTPGAGDN
jgi:hypothetical protein